MASQVAIFADTISGMKRAVKRKPYDSDSDSSIDQRTNRGNKLQKRARFVREGNLAQPNGPRLYKKTIEHAGFQREILNRKPRLVDEDGYEVDSEDDDERAQVALVAAAEYDPYAEVKLEHLLAPLTAATDLPDHPTLSRPFISKTLTDLTRQAGDMVQKEQISLWRIRHLLTRLSGDNTWLPCGIVETDDDYGYFIDEREHQKAARLERMLTKDAENRSSLEKLNIDDSDQTKLQIGVEGDGGANMNSIEETTRRSGSISRPRPMHNEAPATHPTELPKADDREVLSQNSALVVENMEVDETKDQLSQDGPENQASGEASEETAAEAVDDLEDTPAPHRMRTRAQAQAASDNTTTSVTGTTTPDSSAVGYIHPYFLAPLHSRPDRDVGLPKYEAEETRRLLQLYIQKQEEVCRGTRKIYEGLLRADRHRQMVLKWAKAEAHVGVNRDMSDGEDWYDKEEWGLDEDLKKGQDEEEEDATITAKKTRTRRQ